MALSTSDKLERMERLYESIRRDAVSECLYQRLAITTVMQDIVEIRKSDLRNADRVANVLEYLLAHPLEITYDEIANQCGYANRSIVYNLLKRMSTQYEWISDLMNAREDFKRRMKPNDTKVIDFEEYNSL